MSSKKKPEGAKGSSGANDRQRGLDNWRGVGSFGTLGLEIVLCIALPFFGGRWLDGKFGTDPYLSIVGFIFGVGAAIKSVMRATREMAAEAAREEREQGNPLPRYDKPDRKEEPAARAEKEIAPDEGSTDDEQGGDR